MTSNRSSKALLTSSVGYLLVMQTLDGHFDGRVVVLDEPAELKPNTKVKVLVPDAEEPDSALSREFALISELVFKKIWDNPLDADYDDL